MIEITYEIISEILFPLLVILISGFAGYFFAKTVGFIAGLNVGVLLATLYLDFPEYALIVMAIIDVLLIFGDLKT